MESLGGSRTDERGTRFSGCQLPSNSTVASVSVISLMYAYGQRKGQYNSYHYLVQVKQNLTAKTRKS